MQRHLPTKPSKSKAKKLKTLFKFTKCSTSRKVIKEARERAGQTGEDPNLAEHAALIHRLGKRVITDIIERAKEGEAITRKDVKAVSEKDDIPKVMEGLRQTADDAVTPAEGGDDAGDDEQRAPPLRESTRRQENGRWFNALIRFSNEAV